MNAQTITKTIFDKADAELKERISQSTRWIIDEVQQTPRSKAVDFPNIRANNHSELPWVGTSLVEFNELAFASLRDKYRQQAITKFMSKVESMAEEMENLGIVVRSNSEP